MMLLDILNYGFVIRGLEAGIAVAVLAPLVGMFLVLRRYSLIADTLSHVSLMGIAAGLLLGVSAMISALAASVLASLGLERLRNSKKVYGESALALVLSAALALAVILLSLGQGFNANVFNYLFGSIVTVTSGEVQLIILLALIASLVVLFFYKELQYLSFDEESAKVGGVSATAVNNVLMLLAAVTVALSIPVVGVLLISAMMVVPVVAALQLKKSFSDTLFWAEVISISSVVAGMVASFYLNVSAGGAIVVILVAVFLTLALTTSQRPNAVGIR